MCQTFPVRSVGTGGFVYTAGYRPCAVCLPVGYARRRAMVKGAVTDPMMPASAAELDALIALVSAHIEGRSVTIGHSRDAASKEAVDGFRRDWLAWGGVVIDVVDWPEMAASWLRQARRFTAGGPDAWIVAATSLGWPRFARRLRESTDWEPGRTFGFASTADPAVLAAVDTTTLDGLRGADPDGGTWRIRGRSRYSYPVS
jgi:hypothetical protein